MVARHFPVVKVACSSHASVVLFSLPFLLLSFCLDCELAHLLLYYFNVSVEVSVIFALPYSPINTTYLEDGTLLTHTFLNASYATCLGVLNPLETRSDNPSQVYCPTLIVRFYGES